MFNTILLPTDGSELSDKAMHAAIDFAQINHSRIVALSVREPYPFSPLMEGGAMVDASLFDEDMRARTLMNVQKVAAAAASKGIACVTQIAESGNPHEEIIRVALEHGCDIIFMASHGRKGLSRLFVGSETQKVLAHSTIPVLVFR